MVDDALLAWIEEHVLVPTVHTMKRNRKPFRGVLYAGLMLTPQSGPKVLEYNCRFGDPECTASDYEIEKRHHGYPRSRRGSKAG